MLVHAPAGQPPWRIGIEDPDDPSRVLWVVERRSGAVATSGSAHRGSHIIDPRTRRPATAVRAVTVVGPQLMWAAAAQGPSALDRLDDVDGYEALMVTGSGLQRVTAGWPAS